MNNMAAFGQAFFALGVMIALIFFLAYWLKKAQQWQRPQGQQSMKIVSHLSLGVKEKVILVSVGEQQVLLGVTPNSINHLQTFETPIIETTSENLAATPFAAVLKQHLGIKSPSGKPTDNA